MFFLNIAFLFLSRIGYKLKILSEKTHNTHFINLCKQNGVVFIKWCQILTSSAFFSKFGTTEIGKDLYEQMSQLQDTCHQDYQIHLPDINYIETAPIASGSIAQVYKINFNNKVAALKILLPSIKSEIKKSIKSFRFLRSCLYYINRDLYHLFSLYDLDDYFEFIKKQIQLDINIKQQVALT